MSIDYQEKIPNNVNLADDKRLQRALETWQPGYLDWWAEQGMCRIDSRIASFRTCWFGFASTREN